MAGTAGSTSAVRALGVVLGLAAMVLVGRECAAQIGSGTLAAGTASGSPGATVMIPLTMDNTVPSDGFSFGLAHDGGLLAVTSVVPGAALDSLQGGIDPDIFLAELAPVGGSGFTLGCLVDLSFPFQTIPVGVGHEIAVASYTIAVTATPGPAALTFTGALGAPPVELLLVLAGLEVIPTTTAGSVDVLPVAFRRGDCNHDGNVNLVDGVICVQRLGGLLPPGDCDDADDINDDGVLSVVDITFLLQYLFAGGPPVPAPFGLCGNDPTVDGLNCSSYALCP